jgi:acetyl-CoA C-acetyltransferase
MQRNSSIDMNEVEEVIAGAANQAGEDNRNVARMAALLAGLPVSVGGVTVNRLCASGMQSIMDATRAIMCGDGEIYFAGGVESMTRAPFVVGKSNEAWSRKGEMFDTTMGWRFINEKLAAMYYPYTMGETARMWRRNGIFQEKSKMHLHFNRRRNILQQKKPVNSIMKLLQLKFIIRD